MTEFSCVDIGDRLLNLFSSNILVHSKIIYRKRIYQHFSKLSNIDITYIIRLPKFIGDSTKLQQQKITGDLSQITDIERITYIVHP